MKKNYFFSFITLVFFSLSINSQVIIGDGELVNQSVPIEPFYAYTYSQSIYDAGLINTSGSITGINYFATEGTSLDVSSQWIVYMALSDKNSFEDTSDWIPISEFTTVYTASVESPTTITEGVVSITFDTPFEYDGTSNLVIAIEENQPEYQIGGSSMDFYCSDYGSSVSIVFYSDTTNPDPNDPPTDGSLNPLYLRQSLPNIIFEGITQSCPTPDLTFSSENILGSSATINWTVDSGEGPFQYAYAESGVDADNWLDVSENSILLTELSPLTDYVFYIRKVCDEEYSAYSSFSFTTDCADLFSLPFEEGFNDDNNEGYDVSMPFPSETKICWDIVDLSPDGAPNNFGWQTSVSGNLAYEGDMHARLNTYDNLGKNDDYLITPRLDLTGNDRLKFAAKSWGSGTENNVLEILISETTNNPEDFTTVLMEQTEIPGESWNEYLIDLTAYSADSYIAFRVPPSDIEGYILMLDAVVIEQIPDCDTPINLSVSEITMTTASVSWSAGNSEETEWEYVIQYAELDPPTGGGNSVLQPEIAIENLEPGTDYSFYVRAVCSEGVFSDYISMGGSFSTPGLGDTCAAPIVIDSLPYNVTDDTVNYGDDYSGSAGENCNESFAAYLNGDDVFYSYTASTDTSINILMNPDTSYSGIFVYDSCENIGIECLTGIGASDQSERQFDLDVSANTTYYIVISTWASPQNVGYDLVITENTCQDPVVTATASSCADDQYYIDVDLSDMGSSTQYTISDNLGNEQSLDSAGIVTFGPYTGVSPVEMSVVGDDVNCDQNITVFSACQACIPAAINCTAGDGFLGLVIADIDNSNSGCSTDGYGVFPDLTTDLEQGVTYPVAITTGYTNQYVRAWIDFNDDYEFTLDELIIDNVLIPNTGTTEVEAVIPADANLGPHQMRFKANWNAAVPDDPCLDTNYGEVEDYIITIVESLSINENQIDDLRIFPNPVDGDYVNIFSSLNGDKYVELFDVNGRKVLSTSISGNTLDISGLERGFYLATVTIEGKSSNSKLIID